MTDAIIDNSKHHRYELTVDGVVAHVDYEREPGTVILTHTIVPEQLGGRGIASRLVQHALDDARRQGRKVIPQCSFVAAFIERKPQYRDLVQD